VLFGSAARSGGRSIEGRIRGETDSEEVPRGKCEKAAWAGEKRKYRRQAEDSDPY